MTKGILEWGQGYACGNAVYPIFSAQNYLPTEVVLVTEQTQDCWSIHSKVCKDEKDFMEKGGL